MRLQGTEAGDEAGRWGLLGPRTEQFTIGAIVYLLSYARCRTVHDKGPEVIRLLQNMVFPPLSANENTLDNIIRNCWLGFYPLIADLAETAAALPGAEDMAAATALDATYVAARQEECRQLLRSNLLKMNDV